MKSSSPAIEEQIKEVGLSEPGKYLSFLGTLFLFVATCQPVYGHSGLSSRRQVHSRPPRPWRCVCSLQSRLFGIREQGFVGYLKTYIEADVHHAAVQYHQRTLAHAGLAVRLFGNMMSGVMIIGILLTITPFIFPIVMTVLGLLTGMVQAYIFSILAAVYIAAATRIPKPKPDVKASQSQNFESEHLTTRRISYG